MVGNPVWSLCGGVWATQGSQYYLMAQLAWNPRLDANAVLDDYYRRAFGPAARK